MGVLAESILASFDSNFEITWNLTGTGQTTAHFEVSISEVTVTFTKVGTDWQVGFTVESAETTPTEVTRSSIRVFSGVFQAVRDFLEVREPERLVFTSKDEALAQLYETYLQRQDTALAGMGYKMNPPTQAAEFTEFVIEKTTPSAWNN